MMDIFSALLIQIPCVVLNCHLAFLSSHWIWKEPRPTELASLCICYLQWKCSSGNYIISARVQISIQKNIYGQGG